MKYFTAIIIYLVSFQVHAWVINKNFEEGVVGQKANNGFSEAFTSTKYTDEKVLSGKKAIKSTVEKGSYGFGDWGGSWKFPGEVREGGELWYRVWVYYPAGFDFSCGCTEGIKFLRIRTKSSSGAFEGSWNLYLQAKGVVIATGVNNKQFYENHPWPFKDIRGLGKPITTGEWHAYELYVKFSSVPGKGIIRAWQDGELVFEESKTATLKSSTSKASLATIWTYWNNSAPKTQSAYLDDVIITNERPSAKDANGNPFIGTGSVKFTSPPKPPTLQ
jgi:hypothetical protein